VIALKADLVTVVAVSTSDYVAGVGSPFFAKAIVSLFYHEYN